MMDKPSRYFWLVAILIVVIGAVLRFYDLGGPSLWLDEVFTNLYVHVPIADTLAYVRDAASQSPFYFLTLRVYSTGSDAWLLARQDQIVETKTFNGLALFRLDNQP